MLNTNINKQYIPKKKKKIKTKVKNNIKKKKIKKKKKKTLNKCIYIKCNKINYKQKMNY